MTEPLAIELAGPGARPVRATWSIEALAELDPRPGEQAPAWRLADELDWHEVAILRVISARFEDERLLGVAAVRPPGSAGHGEEIVAGAIGDVDGFDRFARTLVSTEYGPDGRPRRVGLELYREPDGLPLRISAACTATALSDEGPVRRQSTALTLRCAGVAGVGALDIMRRPSPR